MVDATIERTFVGLPSPAVGRAGAGGHPCQGLYHRLAGTEPEVAFIATHFNVDFSEHYLAEHLARRGYGFFGWNTRFRGAEPYFLLDHAVAEIGVGMRWLQARGVRRIVLLGNSGGGSLMAAYHAQSRQPFIDPAPGLRLAPGLDDLPRADRFVFLAAHPGRPEILTAWLDPSVVDEDDPLSVDPALDMYDPRNGPPFDEAFTTRYRAAQEARNHRITDWCEAELDRLAAAGTHDRLFTIHRVWADLRFMDETIDPSARPPRRCYAGDPVAANRGVFGLGRQSTLRSWLHMWSLRESPGRGANLLPRLDLPTLLVQPDADAGVFPGEATAIFDAIGSEDKARIDLPGDHYFQGEGQRERVAEEIHRWLQSR